MKRVLTHDEWRRIAVEVRRWLAESIRLRAQAETVYVCENEDKKRSSMHRDRGKF
ncbi:MULTISPECIES: hypothetical protein [Paraburkholderia]|uniref:hypothetical protein n=1 Tax=Paraburkholderia TaxID=1822464 RepID=UPI00225BD177|nr:MULTISPECIES: hypothetical protein [Paraburkholderia]MCX4163199.1 hypothetical protein [Paraburkholderia megapolitana]MDN7158695.1 hypothetical protein [Paraburkholderia sp. CHISQ3]MDQ6495742.1 hypothetical protein [Paraburkholderia megapolitana]